MRAAARGLLNYRSTVMRLDRVRKNGERHARSHHQPTPPRSRTRPRARRPGPASRRFRRARRRPGRAMPSVEEQGRRRLRDVSAEGRGQARELRRHREVRRRDRQVRDEGHRRVDQGRSEGRGQRRRVPRRRPDGAAVQGGHRRSHEHRRGRARGRTRGRLRQRLHQRRRAMRREQPERRHLREPGVRLRGPAMRRELHLRHERLPGGALHRQRRRHDQRRADRTDVGEEGAPGRRARRVLERGGLSGSARRRQRVHVQLRQPDGSAGHRLHRDARAIERGRRVRGPHRLALADARGAASARRLRGREQPDGPFRLRHRLHAVVHRDRVQLHRAGSHVDQRSGPEHRRQRVDRRVRRRQRAQRHAGHDYNARAVR